MKWLILVYFLVLAFSHLTESAASRHEVNGVLVRSNAGRSPRAGQCTNKFGAYCQSCTTLMTCVGDSEPVNVQKCNDYFPGQPYCYDGVCTSELRSDETCSVVSKCTAQGYFPDPTNCTQYFFCASALGASQLYQCPKGYVYNPAGKNCKRSVTSNDCHTVRCSANPNRYLTYPGDKGLYVFCLASNGIIDPVVFRCNDPVNFVYSEPDQKCIFQCKAEGRVSDNSDCQKYYECYKIGTTFIYKHETCLNGFIYDSSIQACVSGSCEPKSTISPTTTTVADTTTATTTTNALPITSTNAPTTTTSIAPDTSTTQISTTSSKPIS